MEGLILVLIISITDAKHVWGAFIVGIAIFMLIFPLKKRKLNNIKNATVIILSIVVCILGTMYLSKSDSQIYIYDNKVNFKYQAYRYTFSNFRFPQTIIGRGPGTYGSRAANALAYDYMYKTEDAVKIPKVIPSRINEDYKYIAKFFTKEYIDNIKYYSAILSYPISNYITLYGELGLIGLGIILAFAILTIKKSVINVKNNKKLAISTVAIVLIIFTSLVMFIDNYLEMNEFVITLMMFLAFVNKDTNEISEKI